MKKLIFGLFLLCIIIGFLISIKSVVAAPVTPTCPEGIPCVPLENPLGTATNPNPNIPTIVGRTIKYIIGIIGSLTFVVFVYGGALWLTSAGNSDRVQKGLQAMLWAAIGIIVIFSSYAILTLILQTFGV